MGRLEGAVAVVTGGARGQGEAIARRFVAEGAKVVVADVLDDEGAAVAASLGDDALYVHLDVSSEQAWESALAAAVNRFGKVTTLVNNAGIHVQVPMLQMSLAQYQRVVDVNQTGCWLGMKAAAPHIEAAGGGAIVNTSSIAGVKGLEGRSAYGATKWAIRGMTRVAARELGPSGIRVNVVCPGAVNTVMSTDPSGSTARDLPIPRSGRVEEVASMMVFLCSDESSYCTGAEFIIDGGSVA